MEHVSSRAVIPFIITQIAAGQRTINLGSLSQLVILILLLILAPLLAIAACDQALGHVVNAASDFEISIGKTADLIAEVMNADVEYLLRTAFETRKFWGEPFVYSISFVN